MTCDRSCRNDYEIRLAEYLRPAIAHHECTVVYIDHYPDRDTGKLTVTVGGSMCMPEDSPDNKLEEYEKLDEESALGLREISDEWSEIVTRYPPQRPNIDVPFFSIELIDWPAGCSPELDLGADFREAVRLLTDACSRARGWEGEQAFPGLFQNERSAAGEAADDSLANQP